jgi:two-component system KDP operon response regulator KdpE
MAHLREKILVVDDSTEFLDLMEKWLESAGYQSLTAEDGEDGLRRVFSSRPDLVLLDVNMPRLSGWEVCRQIRAMSDIPVIMLTVNKQRADILRGFSEGADDYITKPCDFGELIARVGAVLRRSAARRPDRPSSSRYGEVEVDWKSRQVYVRRQPVKLSPTEFKLLACLIENRGWVVTHEELLQKAWGPDYIGDKSYVKLYIRYLREKIEKEPNQPELILTERGTGYRFSVQKN